MHSTGNAESLRRRAVVSSVLAAALAVQTAVFATTGRRWLAYECIAVLVVLVVLSINFLMQSKRLSAAQRHDQANP
jgi:hypothetical protein